MQIKFFPQLVKNFESLFDTKRNYDTIIYAGEEPNVQEIYAHSIILCCQSAYFQDAYLNDSFEMRDGIYIINKPDVPFQILNKIIRYLYCGKIELKAELGLNIFNLLIIASELNLDPLVEYIQEILIVHQKKFIKNYLFEVLELTTKHEILKPLQNFCLKIICHVPSFLFKKDSYLMLSSRALEIILKQDDFILDEIDIWNLLIKWTHAQNPNVNHNPSRWTKENIEMMKQTIHGFIPLIRFQDVSSNNYYESIFPYEKLLPENLNNEIMQFYLVSNVTKINNLLPSKWPKFDSSRIINKYYFRLFAKWIDGNANSDVSYHFKLLYRASRDGRTTAAFHSKCDNKGATILVSTVLNSNHLLGGYNPLQWDSSNRWKSTKDSFIFSFKSKKDFKTAKVGYSNNDQCSIGCFPSVGPTFGNLIFNNYDSWTCESRDAYPTIDMPERFIVDDYEVFQVTKSIDY